MLKQLTNTQVWVHDQEEALAFYTEKLGLELREDVTVPEFDNFRWLTVGVPGQPDVAITLMAIRDAGRDQDARRQGRRDRTLLRHGRCPGDLRGAEGSRRRVPAGADRAAVRRRCRLP